MSSYGNNPSVPGYWSGAYQPDQLLCGPLQVVTKTVTITGGEVYQRGTVLGRMTESGAYTLCKQGAGVTDGSETPVAILADMADASSGDVLAGVYLMGEFNANRVIFDESWDIDDLSVALEKEKIFLRNPVTVP
ncbi:head decoration protein [Escherichia coli]|nr:head decoration protein [Escherichia coli]EEU1620121.1 head decoration protein [Escherichia coli]EEV9791124.1 head decoration protein [Escherichia coli]EEW1327840.1 head decoration protein [Escherichia coli]EHT9347991.1 head decoration protein [Escherichia coli]